MNVGLIHIDTQISVPSDKINFLRVFEKDKQFRFEISFGEEVFYFEYKTLDQAKIHKKRIEEQLELIWKIPSSEIKNAQNLTSL